MPQGINWSQNCRLRHEPVIQTSFTEDSCSNQLLNHPTTVEKHQGIDFDWMHIYHLAAAPEPQDSSFDSPFGGNRLQIHENSVQLFFGAPRFSPDWWRQPRTPWERSIILDAGAHSILDRSRHKACFFLDKLLSAADAADYLCVRRRPLTLRLRLSAVRQALLAAALHQRPVPKAKFNTTQDTFFVSWLHWA